MKFGWFVVYETDESGATVRGSLTTLLRAVRSGGDIKISDGDASVYRKCDRVQIFEIADIEHVGCEVNNEISMVNGVDPFALRGTPYWTFSWFDTLGNYGLARVSIYGGANLGQAALTDRFGIIWFARVH